MGSRCVGEIPMFVACIGTVQAEEGSMSLVFQDRLILATARLQEE